ncbi:MAG: S-methyl-5-thioribose-1-phosphate isomerase [Candidatus Omnitrophica bacterium]|nr:S-methyl-5-thioribose-1-phosphate isomerase [Candidatus Omnitrophota bacterium]
MSKRDTTTSQIKESPLFWPARLKGNTLLVLDETRIPQKLRYIKVKNTKQAVDVIRQMKTRAFGQFLVVMNTFLLEMNSVGNADMRSLQKELLDRIEKTADALNKSRPTFPFEEVTSLVVNWARQAIEQNIDIRIFVPKCINGYLQGIRGRRLDRVRKIAEVLKDGDSVLTHCNVSGELAMAARIAQQQNKHLHFFATETRPYFQGSKLTAWELQRMGADVTLIADNAIGSVMADKLVNKVIVGSDRSCANGDFANKIGTYQIAVLASEFQIPFYVLTQPSDKIKTGKDIPVEIRNPQELLTYLNKKVVSGVVSGFYPGFDVVPHELVTEAIALDVRASLKSFHVSASQNYSTKPPNESFEAK